MYASAGAHAILQGGMLTVVPLSSAVSDRKACSLGRSLFEGGREWMSSYCFRFRIGLCIIMTPAVAVFGMHVLMFSLESNSARDNVSPWIERLFCSIFPTMLCGPKSKQDLVCRNDKQRQTPDPQVESFSVDVVGPRSSCSQPQTHHNSTTQEPDTASCYAWPYLHVPIKTTAKPTTHITAQPHVLLVPACFL